MTGAFLRVMRDGKWESIEIEHLTNQEREVIFHGKRNGELISWINMLCEVLSKVEDEVKS